MNIAQMVRYFIFHTTYGLVKYLPMLGGDVLRYGVLKLFLKRIEGWVGFRDNVTIWFPEGISIGSGRMVGENSCLDGYIGLTIGQNVLVAHNASIIAEDHGFATRRIPIRRQPKTIGPIVIGDDGVIGCGAGVVEGAD